jgi:4-amino-4-deoxy-L-arabinose transferase-like glycosyltransferase
MSHSWETRSVASATTSVAPVTPVVGNAWPWPAWSKAVAVRRPRLELTALIVLAAVLNLWALSRNGWANDYYSAAVRSMSSSWHDFLFASLDRSGVMTVDKPPLALWVQALAVRVFGYHPLSVLVPQALMGIASVVLVYDLVRRRFGRLGGFVAGLALAVTPITVAISRHNNPDALLVLCCVAALWCAARALEDGRTRWLVLAGVCVGLGFETKMGVALTVVPGIVAGWLWLTPAGRGLLHALRQLLAGGVAMVLVGGAWPALVELTPAADRPWISGTSDNSIFSLIFEYNGLGRVDGQAGGPGGGGGNMFGGTPGPLRLLNSALGGQAGWLLGFALISGLGILAASRLRRSDARTGWLIAVGGAFLTTAVLFSWASGIFHPYYVSLLAPFAAALTGAGAAQLIRGRRSARVVGPIAVVAGVVTELVIAGNYPGQLTWLAPVLIVAGALAVLALLAFSARGVRLAAVGGVLAALLLAPSVWAFDTLGYATSGTFPAGGPASSETGGGGGPFGGSGGFAGAGARHVGGGGLGGVQLFGAGSSKSSASGQRSVEGFGAGRAGGPPSGTGGAPGAGAGGSPPAGAAGPAPSGALPGLAGGGGAFGFAGGGGAASGPFGGDGSLTKALSYVKQHGGGTIVVSSQSSAASAIIDQNANVAGIGGFSGRESDVSVSWLAQEVSSGKIRWVLVEGGGLGAGGPGLPGDTRAGSKAAMAAAAEACQRVTLPTATSGAGATGGTATGTTTGATSTGATSTGTLYDCQGRAAALLSAGARESAS